jgi:hypothetical protein
MPSKKVKIEKSVGLGTFKINHRGFPEMKENVVSRSTVHRWKKAGKKEINCDTACNVKTRKEMGQKLFNKYGMYKSPTQVARLEEKGAPVVIIGSTRTYCPTSFYWWVENEYWPERNEAWAQNFYTDPT